MTADEREEERRFLADLKARSGRDLATALPRARLLQVEDCGHSLMAEKPDEILDALSDFLRAR